MRVSNEEKQKSRARIIKAASRRFRGSGIAATGLAEIMKDAGMTHGGFYKHFEDKEALVREALADAFESVMPSAPGPDVAWADGFRAAYLSQAHRDTAEQGCPIAALGSEIARSDPSLRQAMTAGVESRLARLSLCFADATKPRDAAIRELASLVGAIVIARAVEGPLSNEVLQAVGARNGCDTGSATEASGDR